MIRSLTVIGTLLAGAAAQATTIDFDTLSGSQGASFALSGVTFSAAGGNISGETTPNGSQGLLELSSPRLLIRATFSGGASAVSIDLGDFNADADTIVLRAYDASDTLLASNSALLSSSFSGMMTLGVAASGISYVVFGSEAPSVNGSSVFADNLVFTPGVPEPGTYALMALGLAGVAALARRRRA